MKIQTLLLLFIAGIFASCQSPKGEKVEAESAQEVTTPQTGTTLQIDPQASTINWTASKFGGQHTGTLQIARGQLSVENGAITGGAFTLDMQSATVLDLDGDMKNKLEGHLRSGDFFEANTFPTGTFEITAINPATGNAEVTHTITGNLSLKGITKSVTFPANIVSSPDMVSATTPPFTINRTEWKLTYRSGILGTAKDKIINDEIGLVISLMAKK